MSEQQQTLTIQQALDLAIQHHTAGRLSQAEDIYRQVLKTDHSQPIALHLLGVVAHQTGKNDVAVDLITKALRLKPDHADAHNNLGRALKELGKLDDAASNFRKALSLEPDLVDAHNNLGNVLRDLGNAADAAVCFQKALDLQPDYHEAHSNLGNALHDLGRLEEAVTSYRKALNIKPDFAEANNNLGNALQKLDRHEDAVASYREALEIKSDYVNAHYNLGNALRNLGKVDDAASNYRKALALEPDYADAHNNLGNALRDLGKLEEAAASYQRALAVDPDYIEAHGNLLLMEQYRPGHTADTLYKLHCEWDEDHGRVFRAQWPEHQNTPEPDRRLRIGFVSADLGRHPVGYFVVGLFENSPRNEIETIAYSDRHADSLTERIKNAATVWRSIRGIDDEELAETILNDEVDILIDLTGHTAKNRLLVFARKPAPLQVTWAGYMGTTGLSAIDYLISDMHSTHVDEEEFHSEKILRMPDGYVCYDPPGYAPDVGPLPFTQNGFVTFGSFNNPSKLNPGVLSVWARILGGVENSRLLTKYKGIDSASNVERLTSMFEAAGIDRSRLRFEGHSPHAELLARYNDVDIALDSFPYSGGLTTLEASWMGVPVVTVPGTTFASRHSLSHLSTIGLPELVACDQDKYVELALELAHSTVQLTELRTTLREKMARSPICDGKKFAEGFATNMRTIWRDWCSAQDSGHLVSS